MEKKKSVFSTIANTFSKRLRSADSSQTPPPPPTKNFSNAPNEHSESGFIPTAMPLENKPEEAPKPTETEKRASLQAKRRENFGATADTGMRRMRQELRQAQAKEKKQQKTAQRRPEFDLIFQMFGNHL